MKEDLGVEVSLDTGVSILELVGLKDEGYSVLRSAHVGNVSAYNLTLANAGIPFLLVDHNTTGALDPKRPGSDRNYFPEAVNTRHENITVAEAGRISIRSFVKAVPGYVEELAPTAEYLDELHTQSLRSLFPGTEFTTNTDYIHANFDIAQEIVALAVATMPKLFERIVSPEGIPIRRSDAAEQVKYFGVLQLSDKPRESVPAVLIPNAVDILINFVIEALKSEMPTQYHLSGPDMVQYLLKPKSSTLPVINELYAVLKQRASFAGRLPSILRVNLVPTAEAKFATTPSKTTALTDLLDTVMWGSYELKEISDDKRLLFRSGKKVGDPEIERLIAAERKTKLEVTQATAECAGDLPELFVEPRQLGSISQYDVALEDGLFVSNINMGLSMLRLAEISKFIEESRIRKKT